MNNTLDRFEEIILDHLKKLCGDKIAQKIMDTYLPVMRELQDDHDSAKIQAERFYKAYNDGIEPRKWIDHIHKTRRKYGKMPDEEKKTVRGPKISTYDPVAAAAERRARAQARAKTIKPNGVPFSSVGKNVVITPLGGIEYKVSAIKDSSEIDVIRRDIMAGKKNEQTRKSVDQHSPTKGHRKKMKPGR